MSGPPPTRQALLARKERIALAGRGRELLDKKRAALMHEILRIAETVMEDAGKLRRASSRARRALARAQKNAGPEAVRSAALSAGGEVPLQVSTKNVMGVKVPEIEKRAGGRSPVDRKYAFMATSITIEEAAEAFEAEVNAIVDLADSELRLRRLTDEVRSTSRRLNALDHILIPRLERERDSIAQALADRERADRYRLKKAKGNLRGTRTPPESDGTDP